MQKNNRYRNLSRETLEAMLSKAQSDLEYYENALGLMPKDTFLGVLGFKAEIKRVNRKIDLIKSALKQK